MTNFRCTLLAHSINPVGDEAITFALCYERFVHAEVLTHRQFSRNASSSRAIPYARMRDWILADPALPIHWGSNRSGMQSGPPVADPELARRQVFDLLGDTLGHTHQLQEQGLHKEVINRYLEPWSWINVVITTGRPGLMNFLNLRMTAEALPNIQRLAVTMARAYRASTPAVLGAGEWHLHYVTPDQRQTLSLDAQLIWSTARCAWVSYQTVEGKVASFEQAQRRHDESIRYKHCTPLEHQLRARADHDRNGGPIPGFDQYRHLIPEESCPDFDYETLLDTVYADCDYRVVGADQ
jgi:hypothetical protein